MPSFFRQKRPLRSVLIVASLALAAAGMGMFADVAERNGHEDLGAISAKAGIALAVIGVLYVISKLAQSISQYSDISLQPTNAGLVFSALILLVAILSLSSG